MGTYQSPGSGLNTLYATVHVIPVTTLTKSVLVFLFYKWGKLSSEMLHKEKVTRARIQTQAGWISKSMFPTMPPRFPRPTTEGPGTPNYSTKVRVPDNTSGLRVMKSWSMATGYRLFTSGQIFKENGFLKTTVVALHMLWKWQMFRSRAKTEKQYAELNMFQGPSII